MRSINFLTFPLLTILSLPQLTSAEPITAGDLVERNTGLDIAPHPGESHQLTATGGSGLSNLNAEDLVCQNGYGSCPNDHGWCCRLGGRCCGKHKCCDPGNWCYGGGCCSNNKNGCDGKTCIPKDAQCCRGGSYCKKGSYCVSINKKIRCCPNGKICSQKDGRSGETVNASE